jgi:2-desacetyl-2-hydroxyethyl bacteriochlorophyllide A dehydrogenase
MRAALFHEGSRTLDLGDVAEPRPGPGEVLLRVRAAGLCGSDLGFLDGLKLPPGVRSPLLLGHEVAGEVVEVTRDAGPWRAGDRVVVNPYIACGACRVCRAGRRSICVSPSVIGLHRPGGFAEWLAVPAANLHRLPPGLTFAQGAIVPDAVSTAHHAVVARGALAHGESVAVFGAGGLGTHGILLARLLGAAPLIVVVRREAVAARVRAMGADRVLVGDEPSPVREIRRFTGGQGVDLALDFVGKPESVRACVASARIGGRVVLAGVGDERLTLPPAAHLVRYELDIRGAYGAEPGEIDAVLGLAAAGRLDLARSVSAELPLAEIGRAVERLRDRTGDVVRLVVTPSAGDGR